MLVQRASVLNAPVLPVKLSTPSLKKGCVRPHFGAGFAVEILVPRPEKVVPVGRATLSNPWIDTLK
ncbi:hypothetical protein D3C85_1857900 [compost metagenome]